MIYLNKVLPIFISPLGIISAFIILGIISRKMIYPFIGLVFLWLFSLPILSNSLIGFLENNYTIESSFNIPEHRTAVVLSGMVVTLKHGNQIHYEFSGAVDRILAGIDLIKSGKAKNLIFLGSSCVYPKKAKIPIKEDYLLSGYLEKTNEPYAIAKIAGIKMCQSYNNQYKTRYKCLMPTNTYGPNDNYHGLNSHFFPALIKKVHKIKLNNQKSITIWGNGRAKRELIFVDDLAEACIYFMNKKVNHNLINIGTGIDQTVKQYTEKLLKTLIPDRKVKIKFDLSKPNGTPRKLLDVSLAKKYGWIAKTDFTNSIIETYNSYLKKINNK